MKAPDGNPPAPGGLAKNLTAPGSRPEITTRSGRDATSGDGQGEDRRRGVETHEQGFERAPRLDANVRAWNRRPRVESQGHVLPPEDPADRSRRCCSPTTSATNCPTTSRQRFISLVAVPRPWSISSGGHTFSCSTRQRRHRVPDGIAADIRRSPKHEGLPLRCRRSSEPRPIGSPSSRSAGRRSEGHRRRSGYDPSAPRRQATSADRRRAASGSVAARTAEEQVLAPAPRRRAYVSRVAAGVGALA